MSLVEESPQPFRSCEVSAASLQLHTASLPWVVAVSLGVLVNDLASCACTSAIECEPQRARCILEA